MHALSLRLRYLAHLAGAALLVFSGLAVADPPSRVARLGYVSGPVSVSPAGHDAWDQATLSRPLTTGDRLWSDAGARAEIQVGGATVRMNADTGMSVLNLDDRITQLELTQGGLNVHVRRLDPGQVFEVDTPNLAFTLRQAGEYRIEVEPDGSATTLFMRQGQGEAYGDGASYVLDPRQAYRFSGTGLRDYQLVDAPRPDDFDRWASARDRSYDASVSARYVSPYVVGAQDLDANGTWRVDASYGNVWVPSRVPAGWAPYRDGHWAWVEPWGWTWMDDAPWGFAVSHYGRWAYLQGTWGWVPGPMRMTPVYAPALVAFVGGNNLQLTISSGPVGGVAWFPLAPREVYRPPYTASRAYYERVNRSNTVVNNTLIQNTYNTTNVTNIVYANRKVPGAVIAVPTATFVQSQPVSRAAVRASKDMLEHAPVAGIAHVAPTDKSVHGAAERADKPPARAFERPVMAHTAPPAPRAAVVAQPPAPSTLPSQPGDDAQRKVPNPAVAAPPRNVRVVEQAPAAALTRPPPPATAARQADTRDDAKDRKADAAPASHAAPLPAPPSTLPAQTMAPVPAMRITEPRAKGEPAAKVEERPPAAAAAADAAPKAASPVAQPDAPRGRPDPQGKAAAREPQAAAAPQPDAQPNKTLAPPSPTPVAATDSAPHRPQQPNQVSTKPPAASPPDAAQRARPERAQAPQQSNQLSPKPAPATPPDTTQAATPGKPEPAQTSKHAESRPSAAAPKAPPPPATPPGAQVQPGTTESKPPTGKPNDKGARGEEPKRDDAERKPKG